MIHGGERGAQEPEGEERLQKRRMIGARAMRLGRRARRRYSSGVSSFRRRPSPLTEPLVLA